MAVKNLTSQNIVDRIVFTLPSRFSREDDSEIVSLFKGLAEAFKFDFDLLDELFMQTNLTTATGAYVDEYLDDLLNLGRKTGESDANYKTRYFNRVYRYNSTKTGIQYVVYDLMDKNPLRMYNGNFRGAFFNSRHYYNDAAQESTYGQAAPSPFVGYIEFGRKPNYLIFEDMCKIISAAKAAGITIYLKYPESDLVVDFSEGTFERTVEA